MLTIETATFVEQDVNQAHGELMNNRRIKRPSYQAMQTWYDEDAVRLV